MASNILYPPIVNDTEPAFIVSLTESYDQQDPPQWQSTTAEGDLRIYFSYSALSSDIQYENISVQATLRRKDNVDVLQLGDGPINDGTMTGTRRLRSSGIILNLKPVQDLSLGENYYYITLKNEDLKTINFYEGQKSYMGWSFYSVYKIQIRLSDVTCSGEDEKTQQKWLFENASHFSEWSTVIYSKAIPEWNINIYNGYSTAQETQTTDPSRFCGAIEEKYLSQNGKEYYSYFNVRLFNNDNVLLEESDNIYRTERSTNYFEYLFKTAFEIGGHYKIEFSFVSDNKYQSPVYSYNIQYTINESLLNNFYLETIDTMDNLIEKVSNEQLEYNTDEPPWKTCNYTGHYTSLGKEEEEGRIGLKIVYRGNADSWYPADKNGWWRLVIKRASEEDNFSTWQIIKYLNINIPEANDNYNHSPYDAYGFNELYPIIYDYTIESDTYYKYSIQRMEPEVSPLGYKYSTMNIMEQPIIRKFDYSFLLGQNNQQLKLEFDNTMNSFRHQIADAKVEPVGSKYPYITRNGKMNYKTFPINGLISFNMDENNVFLKNGNKDLFKYEEIAALHAGDREHYNFNYEKKFRKAVLEFLQDGKPKLFKSPSEGNIIIRLTDVNCTPNQTTNRLIYSFSATADEIDDNTMESYLKYGFYFPGIIRTTTPEVEEGWTSLVDFGIHWTTDDVIVINGDAGMHCHALTDSSPTFPEPIEETHETEPPAQGGE